MKNLLLSVLSIVLLTACQKGTTITYTVTNNTGEQITFNTSYYYTAQRTYQTVLNNGETRDILVFGKNEGGFEGGYYAGQYIDSIVGITNTNKRVTKNLLNTDIWHKVSSAKNGTHFFSTTLTENDIQ